MAGNMYGYSTYTNIPAQRGGYGIVENKAIEWVPASTVGYTDFIDSPSEIEPLKEYGHTPTTSGGPKPKNHYDDYDSNYRVNYENSSPPLSPRKYTRGCSSEESNRVHSGPGYVRIGSISGPNKSWHVIDTPATRHQPKNHYDDDDSNYRINFENSSPPLSPRKYTRGCSSEESNWVHSGPGYVRTRSISSPNKSWHVIDTPATRHQPKNHYDDYDSNYRVNFENSSPPISPNRYTRGYFSEESNRVRSGAGYVRTGSISDPNKSWQVTDPPATSHPITRSSNNVNEALGLLEEYKYYSSHTDPMRRQVLADPSTLAQPLEPQSVYENNSFVRALDSYLSYVPKKQSGCGYHGFVTKPNGAHYNFATGYTYAPRADPWKRGLLDDMDSNEAYTSYKSPPEPRRLKWTKGAGWWKTKT